MGLAGATRLSTRNWQVRYGCHREAAERTPTQNFLEILAEASARRRIEMTLKPRNDREMKGLSGSNLPLSASESSVFGILSLAARKTRIWPESDSPGPPEKCPRRGSEASFEDSSLFAFLAVD
jgi:hypothetical protein